MSVRVAAIILNGDLIALMRRVKNGQEYFVFPGGGVNAGETLEVALVREIKEELSIEVNIVKKLYEVTGIDRPENLGEVHYFLSKYRAGTIALGCGDEIARFDAGSNEYYPSWHPVREIENLPLYPTDIRDRLFADFNQGTLV